MEPHAAEFVRNVVEISFAVDVAEDAVPHAVGAHDVEDAHGPAALVVGGIVEDAEDAPRAGRFGERDAPLEAPFFAAQDGRVIFGEVPRGLGDPAPRARERDIAHADHVVVEKFKRAARGFRHLRHRVPPVVVVAPDDDFPAREPGDPQEVRQSFREVFAPREVARDNDRVFRADGPPPGGFDFFPVVRPVCAEDVHGLFRRVAREVEVAECVQFHRDSPPKYREERSVASMCCRLSASATWVMRYPM